VIWRRLRTFCPFSGEDSGDASEVVGYADVGPGEGIKQWLHGGQGIVAEFEDENAAGLQVRGGLGDQVGVEFVAFFAAEEGDGGLVVTNVRRKSRRFAPRDVRRVADDEIEEK